MPMRVMHIRHVGIFMFHPPMLVKMGMRLPRRVLRTVTMLMMFVVHVGMRVHHGLMDVFMFVALRGSVRQRGTGPGARGIRSASG